MRWQAWLEAAPRPFLLLGMVNLPPLPAVRDALRE